MASVNIHSWVDKLIVIRDAVSFQAGVDVCLAGLQTLTLAGEGN